MPRPRDLNAIYNDFGSYGLTLPTVQFYGHSSGQYKSFSNFYEHLAFSFTLPVCCAANG